MSTGVVLQPMLPVWLLAAFAAAAVLLLALAILRRARGWSLRALALLVILALLILWRTLMLLALLVILLLPVLMMFLRTLALLLVIPLLVLILMVLVVLMIFVILMIFMRSLGILLRALLGLLLKRRQPLRSRGHGRQAGKRTAEDCGPQSQGQNTFCHFHAEQLPFTLPNKAIRLFISAIFLWRRRSLMPLVFVMVLVLILIRPLLILVMLVLVVFILMLLILWRRRRYLIVLLFNCIWMKDRGLRHTGHSR